MLEDSDQVDGVFVGVLALDLVELSFTSLSDVVVVVEDLLESSSNVLEFLNVHDVCV
jgi:hypothetical protein